MAVAFDLVMSALLVASAEVSMACDVTLLSLPIQIVLNVKLQLEEKDDAYPNVRLKHKKNMMVLDNKTTIHIVILR